MSSSVGAEAAEHAPLRIGLVGCGDISPMHLDAITGNSDAVLVAVADHEAEAAAATATRYGVPAHHDLATMLERERLDVVHICTPHHQHAPMAVEALRAGVHVLLEKPVATMVADAERIEAAADDGPGTLGVCFQNRYNATSRRIRELIDSGSMGAILGGRASVTWYRDGAYYARRPWRGTWAEAGGGVLINQAIHTLDLLQWFLGDVEQVRGQASQLALGGLIEVEDTAVIRLTHPGGVGSIFYATNGYSDNAPITLELRTERALLRLAGDLTINWIHGPTEVVAETAVGGGERAYWGDAHKLLIADFYRHVLSGRRFWIGAAEAAASLRILTAVYAQSGIGPQTVA
jgi:UDP-N-acetyl-2-amino-2-deoxyglucuronate dehydrogenase